MSIKITYDDIKNFVENQNASILISTKQDFEEEKKVQNKTPNYVKLKYKCSCGEVFMRDFAGMKNSHGLCSTCCRVKGHSRRLAHEEQQAIIESKGLTYIKGEIRNHDTKFLVKCGCGECFETTLRILKNSNLDTVECKRCRIERMSKLHAKPYNEVREFLSAKGCSLLTDEKDYQNGRTKITFVARCGHVHTTTANVVLNGTKHFVCSDCQKLLVAGENNYNWKGGYDSEKVRFRKTYEFKIWVKEVYQRDAYTCQCCGKKGGKLNAHHLDGYNWCVEKRTDVDNGITLCEDCHNDFHDKYGRGNNTKEQFEEYLLSLQQIAS